MKKLIATLALLSCAFSINASCDTFRVSPCSSQVVTIATNSLNKKQFATSVYITKDDCGNKMAQVSLVSACNPCPTPCPTVCSTPVVVQTSCDPSEPAPCGPCGM
jgi:hypothetical protein